MTEQYRPQEPVPPGYHPYPPAYPAYPPGYPAYAGYPVYPPQGVAPPNYLGWAIGSIFLFWPVAIAALIKSGQVDKYWAMGQPQLAQQASASTKTLCLVATIIGAVTFLAVIVLVIVGISAASSYTPYY